MIWYHRSALSALAILSFSQPACALELTPILGYRTGGDVINTTTDTRHSANDSSMLGIIVGSDRFEGGKRYELYYSHQSTDFSSVDIGTASPTDTDLPLSISYLHVGGTAPISEDDYLKTFVSGGMGISYLSPDLAGLESEMRASLSLGIGLRWPVSERVSLRMETRLLATLFNNNASLFCSNGACDFSVSGNYFTQYEAFAGVSIGF